MPTLTIASFESELQDVLGILSRLIWISSPVSSAQR